MTIPLADRESPHPSAPSPVASQSACEWATLDTEAKRERLLRAAASITARRPDLEGAAIRLDLMALAPGRWPRHIRDAWRGE